MERICYYTPMGYNTINNSEIWKVKIIMNQVTIYTTPSCGWCTRAKSYLRENQISFVEKDVSVDRAAATEMISKSKQMGVPVLDINGSIIIGFDQRGINSLLGL